MMVILVQTGLKKVVARKKSENLVLHEVLM
ncbi:hypothetical protein Godav_022354 [Gossypium davidsonii]|uniref:Uncharacterized protein n=1 Tax=Gossypium davidsonii TaxID=34287 RepID=A0A7J8TE99_GOSDV|nr:hypothetical protein [Gossypium davidsonii]